VKRKKSRKLIIKGVLVKNEKSQIYPVRTNIKELAAESTMLVISQLNQKELFFRPMISKLY